MDQLLDTLKSYWNYNSFRPMQREIIESVLQGNDTFALLPTAGGKSLCFQVPTMMNPGLCLVVSPLIALMKDQVARLRQKNITAFAIHTGMSRKEVIDTLEVATSSNCKFLYVAPERLENSLFKEYLPALGVSLIAVDEAHCISQWGYDFRPAYLRIASLRDELPDVPLLALSASATPLVQKDISKQLLIKDPKIFHLPFARQNLSYSAFLVDNKLEKITRIANSVEGSGIIYCKSRRQCEQISEELNNLGFNSQFYHAGLPILERNQRQEDWMKNKTRIMVCTNAFGMGIDKSEVRFVIHAHMPDCLENYYQEAGRAGRDNLKAFAVLLYSDPDVETLKGLPELRFPPIDEIRQVYQALVNYLQIPAGGGEGLYFPFDLKEFASRFRLNTFRVDYALKILQSEGLLVWNEQISLPSKVAFSCSKEFLRQFEQQYPGLEPTIAALLRTYPGIFDQEVKIRERTISQVLAKSDAEITADLQVLHAHSIIAFQPRREKPQVFFLQPRPAIEDMKINEVAYAQRKKAFQLRMETMVDYAEADKGCRSVYIGNYFGDAELNPCGSCDLCLAAKKRASSQGKLDLLS